MGCGSQTGCLGPKPRQRQVYLDLVQIIHTEAKEMNIPDRSQAYEYAKIQLKKKGNLKKLIDNLVSHKSNLIECSNQILQITAKSNSLAENATCLVVVDKIITEFFKPDVDEKPELKQVKSSPPKIAIIDDILPVIASIATNSEIPIDIQQRVNIVYFKIILVILEKEHVLTKNIISSLLTFLRLKDDKINCKNQITRLFELLIVNLKQGKFVEKTNEMIPLLLNRMKENFSNEISKEYMSFFVKKWFYKGQKEKQMIALSYRHVLEQLIIHSYGNTDNIVISFVFILDEDKFQITGMNKIEDLLLHNHEQEQLGRQIIRSLAIFLLKYLRIGEENSDIEHFKFKNAQQGHCKVNCFRLLNKWFKMNYVNINSIIENNPCAIVSAYAINIEKSSSNFQGELKAQYLEVVKYLSIPSILVVTNLLAEEMKDHNCSKERRKIQLNMLQDIYQLRSEVLKDEQVLTRAKFLIDFEKHYSKEIQDAIIKFNTQNIKSINLTKIQSNLEAHHNFRIRMCEFLHSIYAMVVDSFDNYEQISEKAISSTHELSKKMKKISNTHKFLLEILKIFKVMHEKHLHTYLMVFISKVNCFIRDLDPIGSQKEAVTLFFLAFLVQSTLYLLNRKQRVDDSIAKLSVKLEKEPLNTDLRYQIIEKATEIIKGEDTLDTPQELELQSTGSPKKPESTAEWFKEKNDKKISLTQELLMIKTSERSEIMDAFKELFGEFMRDTKSKITPEPFGQLLFHRQPSINCSFDEGNPDKGSCVDEGEESFDQIIGKIREE